MSLEITDVSVESHERVIHCTDSEAGLNGFISVHSTVIGPALGGMRMWPYTTEQEALEDANHLARAMTYKAAVAETGQGGGKAVIIGEPSEKTESMLLAMGRAIESLGGIYITAEDMNITVADLEIVRRETRWVAGLSRESGSSGNPSPITARGCRSGMKACLKEVYGDAGLENRTVAILGAGAVGGILAGLCAEAGAQVAVSDIDPARTQGLADSQNIEVVSDPGELLSRQCDILAPCARGGDLNEKTIPVLNCKIVAGAANNQLADDACAQLLSDRGILYAPDYVINAGGIINIACEFAEEGYDETEAGRRTDRIGETLTTVFRIARENGITTASAADKLAEERLAAHQ